MMDAIAEAAQPFIDAHDAGNTPALYEYILGVLETWVNERVNTMQIPPDTSMPDPGSTSGPSKLAVDAGEVRRDVGKLRNDT